MKFVKIGFLANPTEPDIRIEEALDCDGDLCGLDVEIMSYSDEDERTGVPPHSHLVESQPQHSEYVYPILLSRN